MVQYVGPAPAANADIVTRTQVAIAQASADGKNDIIYSAGDPSGTGGLGDTWFKRTAGAITGQWEWYGNGTAHAATSTMKTKDQAGLDIVPTNLATNPSFETAATGATVVRTNLCTNPNFEVDFTGWTNNWFGPSGSGSLAASPGNGRNGSQSYRKTWSTVTNSADAGIVFASIPVVAGDILSASAWIRSSIDNWSTLYFFFKDAALANVGSAIPNPATASNGIPINAGVYTKSSTANVTVPATAVWAYMVIGPYANATVMGIGDYLDFDEVLIEKSSVVGTYFDGATTDALGFDYGWTGTANASTSTAKATWATVRTNLATNPRASSGAGWTNNNAAMWDTAVISTGVPTHPLGITTATKGNVKAGQTSTEALSIYNMDAQGNTGPAHVIGVWVYSAQAGYTVRATGGFGLTALTAGVWTFVTGTEAANTYAVLAIGKVSGNAVSTDLVYTTGCVAELTNTVGAYFDGTTAAAGDFTYAWTGTANASTSIQRGVATAGVTASTATARVWMSGTGVATGARSLAVLPSPSVAYSGAATIPTAAIIVGNVYTVIATIRATAAFNLNFAPDGLGINSAPAFALNEVREVRLTGTAVSAALSMNIRAVDAGAPLFYVDNFAVVAGTYTGPYFDGDTAGAWWGTGAWTADTIAAALSGLGNVNNTSDVNKPVSTAQATAIAVGTAVLYAAGAYPARPAGGIAVTYIGPVQPSTWIANDTWVDNS